MSDIAANTEAITESDHGEGAHGFVHVMPIKTLVAVWLALLALTVITVAVTWVNLGPLNLWVAMIIATVKASAVAIYFMHLRYDKPFNVVVFIGTLFFVALFISVVLMDTLEYHPDLIPGYAPAIEQ